MGGEKSLVLRFYVVKYPAELRHCELLSMFLVKLSYGEFVRFFCAGKNCSSRAESLHCRRNSLYLRTRRGSTQHHAIIIDELLEKERTPFSVSRYLQLQIRKYFLILLTVPGRRRRRTGGGEETLIEVSLAVATAKKRWHLALQCLCIKSAQQSLLPC